MPKNYNDMVAALGSRRQHFAGDDVLQRLRELREAREREEREPVFRDDPEPVSQFMPGPETEQGLYDANVTPGYGMNLLQGASIPGSAVPVVGDLLGLAGDIQMYKEDPESRKWMNYLLTAAGALPFVPSLAYLMNRGGNAAPNAMRSPGNKQAGAIGYQGSPHKFDALDPTKIGAGEGAQAYGHGMYVAENPKVAGLYKDKLATGASVFLDGRELTSMVDEFGPVGLSLDIGRLRKSTGLSDSDGRNAALAFFDEFIKGSKQDRKIVEQFDFERLSTEPGSFLYEIDVPDEDIAKMLDWDKPLSEQSWFPKESADDIVARVKAEGRKPTEMEKAVVSIKNGTMADKTGNVWYNDLITKSGEQLMRQGDEARAAVLRMREITGLHNQLNIDIALEQFPDHAEELKGIYAKIGATHTKNRKMPPEMASRLLERAGIPGIKYFDQGSRAAGDGTRNMVLFDDLARRAKVLKRNDETIADPSVDEFIGDLARTPQELTIRDEVPNLGSIRSSLTNWEEVPGIQQIPMSEFNAAPRDLFYAADDLAHVDSLANEIRQSGEISPLIVVQDSEGYYVLEGAHRLGALHEMGQPSVPALVIKDLDNPVEPSVDEFIGKLLED